VTRFGFSLLFVFLMALGVHAEPLNLLLRDANTLMPLSGVRVLFFSGGKSLPLETDSLGRCRSESLDYPVRIECKAMGYEPLRMRLQTAPAADTLMLALKPSVQAIPEVVVTGQIRPVLESQSVYRVQSINAAQLAQRGAVTINEALQFELNQFISNDNVLGSSVSIGGISGQNVKVLVNGIPLMGRENGNIDLGQLNTQNIRKVEMIQGPMSVVYGSNAMGGVINIITKSPEKKLGFGVRTYLESVGRYNFSGHLNASRGKHQAHLALARNFFQGWTPSDSLDRFQLWKPKTQYTADLQYQYLLSEKVRLSYFGSYLWEKISNKGIPIVNPYEGYAFDEYYRTRRLINAVNADVTLSAHERLTLTNSHTVYHRNKNRFKKDLVSLDQIETKSAGDQDTSRFHTLNLRGVLNSDRVKNTDLMLGYEYTRETGRSFKLAGDRQTLEELGLFGSLMYRWGRLQVQPSARMILNSRFDPGLTPALHLLADLGKGFRARGSWARGYRTPSLKELYLQFIDQNHTIIGNPDLKPETGNRTELGLEWQRSLGRGKLRLNLTGSENRIRNLITLAVYNSQGILRIYQNLDHYHNRIALLQASYNREGWALQAGGSMTWVEPGGIVPRHQIAELNGSVSAPLRFIRSSVHLYYKYNSRQPVLTVDERFAFTDPIHIANLSLQRRFFKEKLQVQAGVRNLLNMQTAGLNGAGTTLGNPHSGSGGMQVFPGRSVFFDLQYTY
jgi:outer membrane receptor for ferrienterochelin and colicins